jgi:hypothetical protein
VPPQSHGMVEAACFRCIHHNRNEWHHCHIDMLPCLFGRATLRRYWDGIDAEGRPTPAKPGVPILVPPSMVGG